MGGNSLKRKWLFLFNGLTMRRRDKEKHKPYASISGMKYICCKVSTLSVLVVALLACSVQLQANAAEEPIKQYLKMDLSQLMEVTITSVSKKPQTLADTAAAVYVISQDDILRSGATTLPEVLAIAPGIHVAQITSSKWSVSSRGFAGYTSNKLLVLLDGRSVYSPAFSGTFWDMPHTLLEDVDRIEVIRGPGGTIWGANAVNGVINIITKKAEDTQGSLVRLGTGSHERFSAAARHGGRLSESTYGRLYFTTNDRESFTLSGSDRDGGDSWVNYQTGFRVDGGGESDTNWTIQGDVFKNSGDQYLFPQWLPGPPYLIAKEASLDNSGANLTTSLVRNLSEGQKLSLQLYYDYNSRDEEAYSFEFRTFDFDLNYEKPMGGRNTVSLGAGYRNVNSSGQESFQLGLPDRSDNLYSAFIQDEIRMLDSSLIATIGLKWEHNDFTGQEWQPSAKLLWKVKENQSLWFSIARAVRTPAIIEDAGRLVFASFPTPFGDATSTVYGNSSFESETLYAYEAGYRWQASAEFSADIAVFYNDYKKLYDFRPVDGAMTRLSFENSSEAESYGFETSVKWQATDWLNLEFTYAFLHFDTEIYEILGANSASTAVYDTTSPDHQVGIRCSMDVSQNWQLNTWLRYQDETRSRSSANLYSSDIYIDDYFSLDMNIIWRPKNNLEIMVAGKNLLEDGQLQYAAEAISAPTDIERSVFAKATIRF